MPKWVSPEEVAAQQAKETENTPLGEAPDDFSMEEFLHLAKMLGHRFSSDDPAHMEEQLRRLNIMQKSISDCLEYAIKSGLKPWDYFGCDQATLDVFCVWCISMFRQLPEPYGIGGISDQSIHALIIMFMMLGHEYFQGVEKHG